MPLRAPTPPVSCTPAGAQSPRRTAPPVVVSDGRRIVAVRHLPLDLAGVQVVGRDRRVRRLGGRRHDVVARLVARRQLRGLDIGRPRHVARRAADARDRTARRIAPAAAAAARRRWRRPGPAAARRRRATAAAAAAATAGRIRDREVGVDRRDLLVGRVEDRAHVVAALR